MCAILIIFVHLLSAFRYGKIQSVKLLEAGSDGKPTCIVAFMDIKSASKAHNADNEIEGALVHTQYSEPTATGSTVTVTRTREPEASFSQQPAQAVQPPPPPQRTTARYPPGRGEG